MAGDSFKHFSENFIKINIIAKFCNEAENNFPTNQFFLQNYRLSQNCTNGNFSICLLSLKKIYLRMFHGNLIKKKDSI